ncbi:hypothetical protein NPIL_554491 [Nephila pilipes]|uniref:Uncharacterized protein n=1 Tax=Nephila pilipes TaxID=299642 RepID=A0A8X6P7S7_NEPPI|nr:hypothetical protein NPIL_554491 [Nephila pilipes]
MQFLTLAQMLLNHFKSKRLALSNMDGSRKCHQKLQKDWNEETKSVFFPPLFNRTGKNMTQKKPKSLEREREEKRDCHPQTSRREENSETANTAGSALEIVGRLDQ